MSTTMTHAPAVEAIIPAVLTEMNAALKPRNIAIKSQIESDGSPNAVFVFDAMVAGEPHRETLKLAIDPEGAVRARCGYYVMADIPTVANVAALDATELKKVLSQYVDWIVA